MTIPIGITREDVLEALARIPGGGTVQPFRESRDYDLLHHGVRYAPKAVIGLAARRVLGRDMTPDEFSGGEGSGQANERLVALGFRIVSKRDAPSAGPDPGGPIGLILTNNPGSKYGDVTGVSYEYPRLYRSRILTGRRFVYYRSRVPGSGPVYFGTGIVGDTRDSSRTPSWLECDVLDYTPFEQPVPFKASSGEHLEPGGARRGYYQQGVRTHPESVVDAIVAAADLSTTSAGSAVAGRAARRRPYASSDLSKRVDQYAVAAAKKEVEARFPGLDVIEMPHNNPGFDLEVRDRAVSQHHVEVKGTSSAIPGFLVTEGERKFSIRNADRYSLVVVAGIDVEAGTHRAIHWHDGEVGLEEFSLEPERWRGSFPARTGD